MQRRRVRIETGTRLQHILETATGAIALDAWATMAAAEPSVVARLAKFYVPELKDFSVDQIVDNIVGAIQADAKSLLPADAIISDPYIVNSTRADKSYGEGSTYYDIVVQIRIPGTSKIAMVIINIEVQNNVYPWARLEARVQYQMCRLVVSQHGKEFVSPHFENICPAYSLWIVPNPPEYAENRIIHLWTASRCSGGAPATAKGGAESTGLENEERDTFCENHEIMSRANGIILWLGSPDATDRADLRFLDVLFSTTLNAQNKSRILKEEYNISPTTEMEEDLEMMGTFSAAVRADERKKVTEEVTRENVRRTARILLMQNLPIGEARRMIKENWPELSAPEIDQLFKDAQGN